MRKCNRAVQARDTLAFKQQMFNAGQRSVQFVPTIDQHANRHIYMWFTTLTCMCTHTPRCSRRTQWHRIDVHEIQCGAAGLHVV